MLVAREAADGYLPVEAHIIEPLGSYDIVDLKVGSQMLRARTKSGFVAKAGDQVFARIDPAQAHFFDTASGKFAGGADSAWPISSSRTSPRNSATTRR